MKKLVGLASKRCIPCEGKDVKALDLAAADKLRSQTPGWRILQEEGGTLRLRQDWKVSGCYGSLYGIEQVYTVFTSRCYPAWRPKRVVTLC